MTKSDMKTNMDVARSGEGSRTAEDVKEAGREMAESGKQMLSDAKSKVTEVLSGVAAEAGERLDSTKSRIADQGDRMAESLRDVASRDEEHGIPSRMLESVASGLTTMTDTLRDADPRAMMSGVQRFAQRNPVLFATGAAVAGLLIARALAGSVSTRGDSFDGGNERSMGFDGDQRKHEVP
jgi:ElaB/YqjD/DUF883 family membrane-anchored ribosome-binding protein